MQDNPLEDQTDVYTTHLAQSFCKFAQKNLNNLAQVADTRKLKDSTRKETREYVLIICNKKVGHRRPACRDNTLGNSTLRGF